MKKFSSILPANKRLTTVDLTASPTRRPGSYNPYTGEITRSVAMDPIKPAAVEPMKIDKVSLSSEAEALKDGPKTEVLDKTHTKLKGYG